MIVSDYDDSDDNNPNNTFANNRDIMPATAFDVLQLPFAFEDGKARFAVQRRKDGKFWCPSKFSHCHPTGRGVAMKYPATWCMHAGRKYVVPGTGPTLRKSKDEGEGEGEEENGEGGEDGEDGEEEEEKEEEEDGENGEDDEKNDEEEDATMFGRYLYQHNSRLLRSIFRSIGGENGAEMVEDGLIRPC